MSNSLKILISKKSFEIKRGKKNIIKIKIKQQQINTVLNSTHIYAIKIITKIIKTVRQNENIKLDNTQRKSTFFAAF